MFHCRSSNDFETQLNRGEKMYKQYIPLTVKPYRQNEPKVMV